MARPTRASGGILAGEVGPRARLAANYPVVDAPDWLVVDVIFNEPRVYDPPNVQVCDPRRPTTVVSGGPGRRRWEFMALPDE